MPRFAQVALEGSHVGNGGRSDGRHARAQAHGTKKHQHSDRLILCSSVVYKDFFQNLIIYEDAKK